MKEGGHGPPWQQGSSASVRSTTPASRKSITPNPPFAVGVHTMFQATKHFPRPRHHVLPRKTSV
jgi:hypothetical protein